jgi:hypothetical protein
MNRPSTSEPSDTHQWADVQPTAFQRRRFAELAAQWKTQSAPLSSSHEMAMLPSYQAMIGLGQPALPLIFAEMRKEPDHWFWALRAITGENPVPPEHVGKLDAMARDWLEWAAANGFNE